MKPTNTATAPVLAMLFVVIFTLGSMLFEGKMLLTQTANISKITTAATMQKANNDLTGHLLSTLLAQKGTIQILWRKMNNSIHRFTLVPGQTRQFYDIGAPSVDPTNLEIGADRKYFKFATDRAEFHRLLPALVDFENNMVFAQIKRLSMTLPPGIKPLSKEATYLRIEGEFALPAEDRAAAAITE